MATDLASVVAVAVLLGMLLLQPFTWISAQEEPMPTHARLETAR
jgi:hypothetical protein